MFNDVTNDLISSTKVEADAAACLTQLQVRVVKFTPAVFRFSRGEIFRNANKE